MFEDFLSVLETQSACYFMFSAASIYEHICLLVVIENFINLVHFSEKGLEFSVSGLLDFSDFCFWTFCNNPNITNFNKFGDQ